MYNKIYIVIIFGLIISLAFTIFISYQLDKVDRFQPVLTDGKILAYEKQICELQQQVGYPVCQVGGKIIEFDSNYFDVESCKLQFKMGQQECMLSDGKVVKSMDEFE